MTHSSDATTIMVFILAYLGIIFFLCLVSFILRVIGLWRMFTKAGEKGWKSIIPFYNEYVLHTLVWDPKYFWIKLAATFVLAFIRGLLADMNSGIASVIVSFIALALCVPILILNWYYSKKTANAYGKGNGFGVGLFFLSGIFRLIIGLDNSRYVGKE